jgi:hypothetical protein
LIFQVPEKGFCAVALLAVARQANRQAAANNDRLGPMGSPLAWFPATRDRMMFAEPTRLGPEIRGGFRAQRHSKTGALDDVPMRTPVATQIKHFPGEECSIR